MRESTRWCLIFFHGYKWGSQKFKWGRKLINRWNSYITFFSFLLFKKKTKKFIKKKKIVKSFEENFQNLTKQVVFEKRKVKMHIEFLLNKFFSEIVCFSIMLFYFKEKTLIFHFIIFCCSFQLLSIEIYRKFRIHIVGVHFVWVCVLKYLFVFVNGRQKVQKLLYQQDKETKQKTTHSLKKWVVVIKHIVTAGVGSVSLMNYGRGTHYIKESCSTKKREPLLSPLVLSCTTWRHSTWGGHQHYPTISE